MRIDNLARTENLDIKYPDGELTDISLKVISTDSKPFHAVVMRQTQEARDRETPFTVEQMAARSAEQLAACIVGWSGIEDADGQIPYSPEKAVEIMRTENLMFMREQVEGFVTKRTHFFRKIESKA
jgi:hypothetical protein